MTVTISPLANNSLADYAEIYALNNEGVAVGAEGDGAIWQNGTVAGIDMEGARAINNSGVIVGDGFESAEIYQNGVVKALPTLGGIATIYTESANGISDSGLVVGVSAAAGGLDEAVLWQNGVATNLGTLAGGNTPLGLGYINSNAEAINASGQIAGYSLMTGDAYHAVMWQSGKITDLGVFAAGDQSFATAINASGAVVGYDMPASFESKAFLWQNGKMTDLGTLPGDNYSTAEAINASGIIVGQAGLYANPAGNHAVMWQNGQIYDLNNLISPTSGWFLQTADAINDNGEIVGRGYLTNGKGDGTYELILTGNAAVVGATVQTALQSTVTTSVAVVDSGANVQSNLDALETLWQNNLLTSVTLSDRVAPAWTLTATQFDTDANVLAVLQSSVSLTVTGAVEAYQAAEVSAAPVQLTSPLTVSDTAENISYWLDGLASGAASGKIGGVTISAGAAVIDLSSDQLTTDQAGLKAITNQVFSLAVTPSSATASIDGAGYGTTVVLSGDAALYTITPAGNGTGFTLSGNGVDDTISNVTALQFADHTVIVASQTPQVAGGVSSFQVATLYAAVLDRQPDIAGLAFYEKTAATGQYSITTFAEWFLQSPEYTSANTYAQTSAGDALFITDTYYNLLSRAPEAGAVTYYETNVIDPILAKATPGTAAYTQAELLAHATVLTYFSQSPEFKGDVAVTASQPADATHWLALI